MSRRKKPLVLEPTVVIIEPDDATIHRYAEQLIPQKLKELRTARTSKTQHALAMKRQLGGFTGGVSPYGFANHKGKLIPIESEQATIRIIIELKRTGLSIRGITERLSEMGYTQRNGNPFHHSMIGKILQR